MMENVLSFLHAAAPWISMGLLIAFLCIRPAIRKGKAEDDYAEEGMCVGMCLGLMLGSLSDSSNSGLGASLGMLFGLVIGLCMHKNLLRKVKRKLLFPTGFSFYLVLIIFVYTKKADFHQPIISCLSVLFYNALYTSLTRA